MTKSEQETVRRIVREEIAFVLAELAKASANASRNMSDLSARDKSDDARTETAGGE